MRQRLRRVEAWLQQIWSVRSFIGVQLVAYGLMRSLALRVPSDPKLSWLSLPLYGMLQMVAGSMLLLTVPLRFHLRGRLAAAAVAGICGMLAWDFAPAWNGVILYGCFVGACLLETLMLIPNTGALWAAIVFGGVVAFVGLLTLIYAARRRVGDLQVRAQTQHNTEELLELRKTSAEQHTLITRLLRDLGAQQAKQDAQDTEISSLRSKVATLEQENAQLRTMNDILSRQLASIAPVNLSGGATSVSPRTNGLRRMLGERFSEEELQTLCSDLGLDYATLEGGTKGRKISALVGYYERRGQIEDLARQIRTSRPDITGV